MDPIFIKAYLKKQHGSLSAFAKLIGVTPAHLGNVIAQRDHSTYVKESVYDAIRKDVRKDTGKAVTIKHIFPEKKR